MQLLCLCGYQSSSELYSKTLLVCNRCSLCSSPSSHSYGWTLRLSLRIILCYLWNTLSVTIMLILSKKTVFKIFQRKCRSLRNSKWVIRFWWTISVSFFFCFRFRWSASSFSMFCTKSQWEKQRRTKQLSQKKRRKKERKVKFALKEKCSLTLKNNLQSNPKKKLQKRRKQKFKQKKKHRRKSCNRNSISVWTFCFTVFRCRWFRLSVSQSFFSRMTEWQTFRTSYFSSFHFVSLCFCFRCFTSFRFVSFICYFSTGKPLWRRITAMCSF